MFLSKINLKLFRFLLIVCLTLIFSLLAAYFFVRFEHDSVSSRRAGGMKLREISQKYVEQIGICVAKKSHEKSCSGDEFVRDNVLIFNNSEREVVAIDFRLKIVLIQVKDQDLWKCYVPKDYFPIVGCDSLE